jgi:predicted cupin superfamily sugar epimerase
MPDRASELIRVLDLRPHPEGGHFREVHRSATSVAPEDGTWGRRHGSLFALPELDIG